MNQQEREDFLKKPVIDLGGRHKNERLSIARIWGDTRDKAAVAPLSEVAGNPKDDQDVRCAAMAALGQIGGGQVVPVLAQALRDYQLRIVALEALGAARCPEAVAAMLSVWSFPTIALRDRVRSLVTEAPPASVAEALIGALDQPNTDLKAFARGTLTGDAAFLPYLVDTYAAGTPSVTNETKSLLKEAGVAALPVLLGTLSSAAGEIRTRLVRLVEELTGPSYAGLIEALGDQATVRATGARISLQQIGAPAVRPLLASAATQPEAAQLLDDMEVAIAQALEKPQENDAQLILEGLKAVSENTITVLHSRFLKIGVVAVPALLPLAVVEDSDTAKWANALLLEVGQQAVAVSDGKYQEVEDALEAILKNIAQNCLVAYDNPGLYFLAYEKMAQFASARDDSDDEAQEAKQSVLDKLQEIQRNRAAKGDWEAFDHEVEAFLKPLVQDGDRQERRTANAIVRAVLDKRPDAAWVQGWNRMGSHFVILLAEQENFHAQVSGNWRQAIGNILDLEKEFPGVNLGGSLGFAYHADGNYAKAIECYRRALEDDIVMAWYTEKVRKTGKLHLLLAKSYALSKAPDEAMREAKLALDLGLSGDGVISEVADAHQVCAYTAGQKAAELMASGPYNQGPTSEGLARARPWLERAYQHWTAYQLLKPDDPEVPGILGSLQVLLGSR